MSKKQEWKLFKEQIKKENKKLAEFEQEIIVLNILSLEILEKISLFLHIIAIFTGIISLIGFGFHINPSVEITFEFITIIVVILIVLWSLTKPIIKRGFLRRRLKFIWGQKQVKTRLSTIEQISVGRRKNNGELISIIDQKDYISVQNIWMGFTKNWGVNRRFIYKIELTGTWKELLTEELSNIEGKKMFATMIPSFILLDMKERIIELTSKNTLVYSEDKDQIEIIKMPIVFRIQYETKEMNWSGTLPKNPTHGSWELVEEEILN